MTTKVGYSVCNGLLAEANILGKSIPKTREQYELCMIRMAASIEMEHAGGYDSLLQRMIRANYHGIPCISIDTEGAQKMKGRPIIRPPGMLLKSAHKPHVFLRTEITKRFLCRTTQGVRNI